MSISVLALLFVLVPLGVTLLIPSTRAAALTSLLGAVATWVLMARYMYLSPIPLNEPEWWGGLAIVCTLASIGVVIGFLMRRRYPRLPA